MKMSHKHTPAHQSNQKSAATASLPMNVQLINLINLFENFNNKSLEEAHERYVFDVWVRCCGTADSLI